MTTMKFCVHTDPVPSGTATPCEFCDADQMVCDICNNPVPCPDCWEDATEGDLAELHLEAWSADG